jgi:hypothetical protein
MLNTAKISAGLMRGGQNNCGVQGCQDIVIYFWNLRCGMSTIRYNINIVAIGRQSDEPVCMRRRSLGVHDPKMTFDASL